MKEGLHGGMTEPPETSNIQHAKAVRRRSEAARQRKFTRTVQNWERVITRKPRRFKPQESEKLTGSVGEFIRYLAHAVNHQARQLRRRRNAANYAIELANHQGQPQNMMKPRQLSRQWRRLYKGKTPR